MTCAHKTSACQAGRMAALPAPPILARACTSDTGGRLSAKRLEASCAISDALRNTHEHTSPDRDSVRARTPARSAQRQGTTRGRNRPRPRKRDEAMTQTTTAPRTLEGTKGLRNAPPVGALPTAQGGTQAPWSCPGSVDTFRLCRSCLTHRSWERLHHHRRSLTSVLVTKAQMCPRDRGNSTGRYAIRPPRRRRTSTGGCAAR